MLPIRKNQSTVQLPAHNMLRLALNGWRNEEMMESHSTQAASSKLEDWRMPWIS